jgi:excisionase family DNA binding protein
MTIEPTQGPAMRGHHIQPLAYSIDEACRVSSLGRTRLYQLINEGKLQVRKIGKRTLVPAASLRALIDGEG